MPTSPFSIASRGCQPGAIRCYVTDRCCGLGEGSASCTSEPRSSAGWATTLRTFVLACGRTIHLKMQSAAVTVLAHTRWASVGRTSASNAHPVDNAVPNGAPNGPVAIAVLNGDVDNYLALSEGVGYIPDLAGVTTDAKLIPLLVSGRSSSGPLSAIGRARRRECARH